jgi:hypothetical protein
MTISISQDDRTRSDIWAFKNKYHKAALKDFSMQTEALDDFNTKDERKYFPALVFARDKKPSSRYSTILVMVKVPRKFAGLMPDHDGNCTIELGGGTRFMTRLTCKAKRLEKVRHVTLKKDWNAYHIFSMKVRNPEEKTRMGRMEMLKPLVKAPWVDRGTRGSNSRKAKKFKAFQSEVSKICPPPRSSHQARIEVKVSKTTFKAEVGSLEKLCETREDRNEKHGRHHISDNSDDSGDSGDSNDTDDSDDSDDSYDWEDDEDDTDLPSEEQLQAFRYLVQLEPSTEYNLLAHYPHMENRDLIQDPKTRQWMEQGVGRFDALQTKALTMLNKIPDRVCLVTGCPGSGKTTWGLQVLALAQAGSPKCRVLVLADINKTLDSVALRMKRLYKDAGMNRTVIRMRKFPDELEMSRRLAEDAPDWCLLPEDLERLRSWAEDDLPDLGDDVGDSDDEDEAEAGKWNFFPEVTQGFLSKCPKLQEKLNLAVKSTETQDTKEEDISLDAAAWEYYDNHKYKFRHLTEVLGARRRGYGYDKGVLGFLISQLYTEVLQEADCIVTSPVSAWCHSEQIGHMDFVLFDEAAHARELSTLIPIAKYTPDVWFFIGDPAQTRPYVEGDPYHESLEEKDLEPLRKSMLERASSQIKIKLLINHRARGCLSRLPSLLFYGERMKTAPECLYKNDNGKASLVRIKFDLFREMDDPLKVCRSTLIFSRPHWQKDSLRENRLIKHMTGITPRDEFWNNGHQEWVMKIVRHLLLDPMTLNLSDREHKIAIISPYTESTRKYTAAVKELEETLPSSVPRGHVIARTVQGIQGCEVDIVIFDVVKSTPFTRDPHNLCVALTRAVYGEIIVMNEEMHGVWWEICNYSDCKRHW